MNYSIGFSKMTNNINKNNNIIFKENDDKLQFDNYLQYKMRRD